MRAEANDIRALHSGSIDQESSRSSIWAARIVEHWNGLDGTFYLRLVAVFVAYFVAGTLGQATANIRSSNLGPVWPAYGVALAAFLAYGRHIWPAIAVSAFVVAVQGSVSPLAACGQAAGATAAAASGMFALRRLANFDPSLERLRDAVGLIALGAFGSSIISASIGITSLYATGIQPYSGLTSAWLIYWLGDSTGVLLVTPLVFTLPQLLRIRSAVRITELAALLTLLTAVCFLVFGDLLYPIRLHALAFVVMPFVMWGAIRFGIAGGTLSVVVVATIATLLTALGYGPFSENIPLINAALLDVLFVVLATSALVLPAVIAQREQAEGERAWLLREPLEADARRSLADIVESSNDAILCENMDGIVLSWNQAAARIFGFTETEAVGQPISTLISPGIWGDRNSLIKRLNADEKMEHVEAIHVTRDGQMMHLSSTISGLRDTTGRVVGVMKVVHDISDQKRAQVAITDVNSRLINAQEQERARIARELHDDIGQRLALLTAKLTGVSGGLQTEASEITAAVQTLSRELHPAKIELLGIDAGMRYFCRDVADEYGIEVDFASKDVPSSLSSDVSLTLFRILQEALHNSAKHSGVRECTVRLWGSGGAVHLLVADPGVAFDVEAAKRGRGIGLISMEERIKLVGGTLSIESGPQRGTMVHARVALNAPPSAPLDEHRWKPTS